MFDAKDPTRIDRIAMLHEGERMIAAHPLTGVGPNMVERRYAAIPRRRCGEQDEPAPAQQPAADRGRARASGARGLALVHRRDRAAISQRRFASGSQRFLAAAALAAIVALLTAGLFEYNFGDSEVLMLFLIVVTLPAAADAARHGDAPA